MSLKHKILFVIESSGGGSGRHVIDLLGELVRRGHSVHLIYSGVRMEDGFRRALQDLGGANLHRLDMQRSPHPQDVKAVLGIRKYIAKYGPFDVIHGHSSKGGALARLAATGMHVVRVYTPHAFRTLDPKLRGIPAVAYKTIERCLGYITDGIILVSEEEKKHALDMGLSSRKLFVVPNGIAPRAINLREEARQTLELRPDDLCIGFVGRYVHQKNPASLVKAFAHLPERLSHARLVMLGDGPLLPMLEELAEQSGVAPRITWVTGEAGEAIMPAFDVFVMPSLYEGFPYVLLEAAAAGLPIITTPVGGASELVENNVSGYITARHDPEVISREITKVLDNPVLRQEMGRASRRIAMKYTIDRMVDGTLKVYEQLSSISKKHRIDIKSSPT